MDRYAALAMLESGNNDFAIGTHGEISRYQILPSVAVAYNRRLKHFQNRTFALSITRRIMASRCHAFSMDFNCLPTDFQFYILWNAPGEISYPSKKVIARAQRFANLCSK